MFVRSSLRHFTARKIKKRCTVVDNTRADQAEYHRYSSCVVRVEPEGATHERVSNLTVRGCNLTTFSSALGRPYRGGLCGASCASGAGTRSMCHLQEPVYCALNEAVRPQATPCPSALRVMSIRIVLQAVTPSVVRASPTGKRRICNPI